MSLARRRSAPRRADKPAVRWIDAGRSPSETERLSGRRSGGSTKGCPMPRPSRLLVPLLLVLGLVLTSAPPTSAAPLRQVYVKTVRIGDKPVRFVLAVDGVRAYVQMKFRRDGRWRTVASDRTDCNYRAGSYDPGIQVQRA